MTSYGKGTLPSNSRETIEGDSNNKDDVIGTNSGVIDLDEYDASTTKERKIPSVKD
ncbi:hypothetical protein MTR_8g487710 [Medicago truncatula]|uniref:Uncharacterized protein n=1 Tax=Medicago truncatula TaxID=3880 RepID=A0A072TT51_MEDTR|nr:hypothetical protein MTR_8g487710 [Medicago truncatula]